jgi:ParB-like nuclease domain
VKTKNRILSIAIDDIKVVGQRRSLDKKKLPVIADSMKTIGLKTPITVQPSKDGGYVLIAGLHRLETAKSLGWKNIDCIVIRGDKIKSQLWTEAENLHRAGLTALQRAEAVAKWKRLAKKLDRDGQTAQPGGHQPNVKQISKVAKQLGTTREAVRRAEKAAGISPKAKAAAIATGVDKNQAALLEVAKEPTPKAQTEKVLELAKRKSKATGKLSTDESDQLKSLIHRFEKATKFKSAWEKASAVVRKKFIKTVLLKPISNQS